MKKFLTLLLALSVVFTYTVGTAFAAAPTGTEQSTFNQLVDSAEALVLGEFDRNFNQAYTELDTLTSESLKLTKESVQAGAKEYQTAQHKVLDARAKEMKEQYAKDTANYSGLNVDAIALLFDEAAGEFASTNPDVTDATHHNFTTVAVGAHKTVTEMKTAIEASTVTLVAAAKAEFATVKADALKVLGLVDLSQFTKTTQKIAYNDKSTVETSYYALAQAYVNKLVANVNNSLLDDTDTTVAKVKAKIDAIGTISSTTTGDGTGTVMENLHYDKDTYNYTLSAAAKAASDPVLKTAFEEQTGALTLDAAKKTALATMNTNVSNYLNAHASTAADLASAKELTDAYIVAQTYRINEAVKVADLAAGNAPIAIVNTQKWVENVAAIAELEAYAAKCKAETNGIGELVRDADKVKDILDTAKVAAYNNTGDLYENAAAKTAIRDNCYVSAAKTEYVANAKKAEIEAARKAKLATGGVDNYYEPEKVKVNAVYDAMLAKVDAAKTDAEVAKVVITTEEAAANVTSILTKTQVKARINGFEAYGENFASLERYKNYLNANASQFTDGWKNFTAYDSAYFQDFYAKQGVRANADITAATYEAAKAVLDAVKTDGQLKTERLAVEKLIAALPSVIAVGDKAAVEAAWKAATDYELNTGAAEITNRAKLNSAISDLFAAELKQARLMRIALPSTLTVADKAAVKAYGDAVKAIYDNVDTDKIYENQNLSSEVTAYEALLGTMRDLEKKAVEDAINALPLNITMDNKAAIEAARKMYDAFVADYAVFAAGEDFTVGKAAYDAANAITNVKELIAAESDLKVAIAEDKEAQGKVVQSLKLKASSKAYKGKIVVKWTVKGDATGVKYQVYKSTKKFSGYKKAFTTSKKSYSNTKQVKKGTRYYYKVRAYKVIDGKTYYSDWSNKAQRIAK